MKRTEKKGLKKPDAYQPSDKVNPKESLEAKRKRMKIMEKAGEMSTEITAKRIKETDTKAIRDDFNNYLDHSPEELSNHDIRRITKEIRKVAREIANKCWDYVYDSDIAETDTSEFITDSIDDEYNKLRSSKYNNFHDNKRKYNTEEIQEILEHVRIFQQKIVYFAKFILKKNPEQEELFQDLSDFIRLTESTPENTKKNTEQVEYDNIKNVASTDIDFDTFKASKLNGIGNAKNWIRKALYATDKNKEVREKALEILTAIQDEERTEENFGKYKKVVNSAKQDNVISTALDKIKYKNDISELELNFDTFKASKLNGIYKARTSIMKNISRSPSVNKEVREKALKILTAIQDEGRTEENFGKYKKVVNSAKYDDTIFEALKKIRWEE